MKVSVIIRNKNEENYIGFAIQSVLDFIPNPEIIIVDNKSTDNSLEVVGLFNKAKIRRIDVESYRSGTALNYGVKYASNDTILILSAHMQIIKLDLDWVEKDLQGHVAVFGKQIPVYKGKKITPRYIWSHFAQAFTKNMISTIEKRPFLHNAFCFYRKQILIDYPFDESLPGKEDRYWAQKILSSDYSYAYEPLFQAYHFYTPNGATWKGLA